MDISKINPERRFLIVSENHEIWADEFYFEGSYISIYNEVDGNGVLMSLYEPPTLLIDFQPDLTYDDWRRKINEDREMKANIIKHLREQRTEDQEDDRNYI